MLQIVPRAKQKTLSLPTYLSNKMRTHETLSGTQLRGTLCYQASDFLILVFTLFHLLVKMKKVRWNNLFNKVFLRHTYRCTFEDTKPFHISQVSHSTIDDIKQVYSEDKVPAALRPPVPFILYSTYM